ncbi:bifunctional anthranilate synthase component II/anthranilate phosphoribosyltransferase [Anaerolineales bacterium HSG24]|nr:bifunctional anthranilate synthase component II/anthranilate phosphoribosyltransferase [Anaerolineales bacterium HSG24]
MILVIDNYDSFTYNLVQYLGELGCELEVRRNDAVTLDEIASMKPSHILISPGPGVPDNAGISLALVERFHKEIPILGVCLGHQVIGQAFGGKIVRAKQLMHGKVSQISHNGQELFYNVPNPFTATRYHSLLVEELPDCLEVIARHKDGNEIMGLRHKEYPVVGVQFHPESILTEYGHAMLRNFLQGQTGTTAQPVATNKERIMTIHIKEGIDKIVQGQSLNAAEAEAIMAQIMEGDATSAQIGSYLTALRMKGETVEEITGSARAMRDVSVKVQTQTPPAELVDTCGTGGDRSGTFNISTTTAFVVAGTGQKVAKHGNRAATSKSGSADVLAALGVNLDLSPELVARAIDEVGIGFIFAVKHHPAMRHAIGPRRELGVRTIFNILGPLTNPAGAQTQIIGVYDKSITEPMAKVLGELGVKSAFVVHGYGGLDELTTTGPNCISRLQNGTVITQVLDPIMLGFAKADREDLIGGTAEENANITREILSGKRRNARYDVTILNAAAALIAAGQADDFPAAINLAQESIDSGAALAILEKFVEFTQREYMKRET